MVGSLGSGPSKSGIPGHRGVVLGPGDGEYEGFRKNYLATFDHIRPRWIARCESPEDVSAAVSFARREGLPVSVRSGGHCFAGFSLCEGVVLDLKRLSAVEIGHGEVDGEEVEGGYVTVGAGAQLGAVTEALVPLGRALPSGSCPTVGVSGQTLGGGLGILGRLHGFTCDQLVAAQVVLADERVVRCCESEEPDLFWALRGGGMGGFGVVTELTFRTVPAPPMTSFYLAWPLTAAAEILSLWQEVAPRAPEELALGLALTAPPGQASVVEVYGSCIGPEGGADPWLARIAEVAGSALRDVRLHGTYRQAMLHQAGLLDISGSSVTEITADGESRQGYRLTRSQLIAEPLPRSVIEELVEVFDSERQDAHHQDQYRGLELAPFRGAYGRVPVNATAYFHRDVDYSLKHAVLLPSECSEEQKRAARRWVDRSWAVADEHGSGGVYPNFPDLALAEPQQAYFGLHLPRLREIRGQYDSRETFAFPHAIPLVNES
ncbi:MAG: FAD-binding oxidoreductase [Acidobacteriota bacterium]